MGDNENLLKNMKAIPVTVALFATTKGHFGKTTLYQDTVNQLNGLIPLDSFAERVVHIKRENGENHDKLYNEMLTFFTGLNFKVLSTYGSWKHYDGSHYDEHAKDIYTLMSSKEVQSSKYVLWIEDDVIIKCDSLPKALSFATSFLEENPSIMNFAIRDVADSGALPNEKNIDDFIRVFGDGLNFSFRCSIFRARDVYALASFYKNSFKFGQSPHIEAFAAQVLAFLSCNNQSLAFFNRDFCFHEHIGVK